MAIPQQSLQSALQELSRQSGVQVVVAPEVTQGIKAPILSGGYSPAVALQVLLRGSGLASVSWMTGPSPCGWQYRHRLSAPRTFSRPRPPRARIWSRRTLRPPNRPVRRPQRTKPRPLQEVIVTGSRIARQDFTSLSPIVTVDAAAIENRSDPSIVNALQTLPQFNVAGNSSNLSQASNPFPSATGAAPGAATVDLRGLGTNRTLVLLDGRRAQPVDAALVIDLNDIPPAAVSSIETITGGAASTYGADAIAGVVNIKLKHDFQGLEVDAQQGVSRAWR